VSFDEVSSLQSWAEDEGFQYELWQDTDKTLAVHFGAADSTSSWFPDRITVLLDADGNQLLSYDVSSFGTHPAQVLEDCEAIFGSR
jgi:peroxiredoxin